MVIAVGVVATSAAALVVGGVALAAGIAGALADDDEADPPTRGEGGDA